MPENSLNTFHNLEIVAAGLCEIEYTIKNFINFVQRTINSVRVVTIYDIRKFPSS